MGMASRRVTIRDVAREAQVSLSAVSLFLNNRAGLSDATRQRIAKAIDSVGYLPRLTNATSPTSNYLGLLIERLPFSPFNDMFYGEVIQGIEAQARLLHYNVTLMLLSNSEGLSQLMERHGDSLSGMIMLGSGSINEAVIEGALHEDFPVVLVDNDLRYARADIIVPDYISGAYNATNYLLNKGYRRIAFIQGPSKYPSLVTRFHGYCAALIDAGIGLDPDLIQEPISTGVPNKGFREIKALYERGTPVDAIFCVTDRTALGALDALREIGVRVPDDVALISFDNIAQASHTTPPLTTVNVPKAELGGFAVQKLHDLIHQERAFPPVKSLFATELVIRSSA